MSRWAAAFRATLAPIEAPEAVPLDDADSAVPDGLCDAPSIRAEPPLAPPGTVERRQTDREHADMVTGLRAAAMTRPPTRWNPFPHNPTHGTE